jgi:hypothetical protein
MFYQSSKKALLVISVFADQIQVHGDGVGEHVPVVHVRLAGHCGVLFTLSVNNYSMAANHNLIDLGKNKKPNFELQFSRLYIL